MSGIRMKWWEKAFGCIFGSGIISCLSEKLKHQVVEWSKDLVGLEN